MTRIIVLALLLVGSNAIQIVRHGRRSAASDCNCNKEFGRSLFGKHTGKFYVHNLTSISPTIRIAKPILQENKKKVPHLFNQDMYMMDHYVHKRFLEDPRRTFDPAEAEFFYIPKLQLGPDPKDGGCTEEFMEVMEKVKGTCEFKCSNGRDHVLLQPRNAQSFAFDTCFYGNSENAPDWSIPIIKLDLAVRRGVGDTQGGARNHHAMPYESDVHYDASQEDAEPPWVQCNENDENCRKGPLVMFAGSTMSPERAIIAQECEDAPDLCERLELGRPMNNTYQRSADDKVSLFNLHRGATFCFEPSGDDPDRRSVWDALLSGCIPVLTKREDGLHPLNKDYSWYVRKPDKIAVIFDTAEGAVQKLKEISPEKISELQANIEQLAPSLQYSMHGKNYKGLPDAFDVMVDHVLDLVGDDPMADAF